MKNLLTLKDLIKKAEAEGFKQAEIIKENSIMVFKCERKITKNIKNNNYTFLIGTAMFQDGTERTEYEIIFNEYTFRNFLGEIVGSVIPMKYVSYTKTDGNKGLKWDLYEGGNE